MSPKALRAAIVSEYVHTLIRVKARQLCRMPGFSRSDEDDLEQEIALYLFQNAHRFDPGRACLHTFFSWLADTAARLILRRRRRPKRRPSFGVQPLDGASPHGEPSQPGASIPNDDIRRHRGCVPRHHEEMWDDADAIAEVLEDLPENLQCLCRHFMSGGTSASAGLEFDLSRREVRRMRLVLRDRFNRAGFGDLK